MPTPVIRRPIPLQARAALAVVALAAVAATVALAGRGDGSPAANTVQVRDATIDLPANPTQAAVRLVLKNASSTDDALLAVSSPVAEGAMVHRSRVDDAGLATMDHVASLPIGSGHEVRFEAGGLHVMLTGLRRTLEVGDEVSLDLVFRNAGTVSVVASVVEPGTGSESDG